MDSAFGIVFSLLALAIPLLIIGGVVYVILKLRGNTSIRFSFRSSLRAYFYVVLLISVGLFALGGVSTLLKVGFGEAVGREFSYGEVYEDHRRIQEDHQRMQERGENQPEHLQPQEELRPLPEKVSLAMKTSLINGVSLTIIGLFLLLVHFFGRRWVETKEEQADLLHKAYWIVGLVIFAIATIVSLTEGVPAALRYALLANDRGTESPGESLSIAIVALPLWIFYLVATIQKMRATEQGD